MNLRFWLAAGITGCATVLLAVDPRLNGVYPPGLQVGTEAELRLEGDRLNDAREILLYHPGVAVVELSAPEEKSVRIKVRVAQDCPLGEHQLRVRSATGITELRTFYVGPYPVLEEDTTIKPEDPPLLLPLNTTVSGKVDNETVDRYRVQARKGDRLSAEVESMRLGRGFYDPYVSILNDKRRILARSDDTSLFIQDCFASTVVPEDGEYTIEVRETSYGEIGLYRLHVGTFARPTGVYPPGGPAGEELEVRLIDPAVEDLTQTLRLPAPAREETGLFAHLGGVTTPSWNLLHVAPFPNVLEAEPNNGVQEATATTNVLPLAFNGIIQEAGDTDWFRFAAGKDQSYDVRVRARSLRSPLDSVLRVTDAEGKNLGDNDDSGGPDSYVRFKVPADGEFALQVRDHLGNGGPDYTYRIEVTAVEPDLTLYVPDSSQYDTHTRKSVVVAKGNRFPLVLNARRADFGGDLKIEMENFPAGIGMAADVLAANKDSMVVVFEAGPDAEVAGGLANLRATLADTNDTRGIEGRIWQNVDLVQDGNQGVYYRTWVDRLAVAVTDALPFTIRIEEPKAPLVRDGTLPIKVVAERKEGFGEEIKVQMLNRPPGLNCPSEITIPKDQDHAIYEMSANGNAEIKEHRIAMLGFANVNGGRAYVATQLAPLNITDSFLGGKIPLATTIQGEPVQVTCELEHKLAFEGKARVELLGLPPGAKTEVREITREDQTVVFDVTTEKDARKGLHRSLFCKMTLEFPGETVTQTFGGRGALRIDEPPPPPKEEEESSSETKPPGKQAANK